MVKSLTIDDGRLEAVLIETVDEALQAILGESGKEVVYYYLQNAYALRKENIPENLEAFTEFLNRLFGAGAKLIENTILKNLCHKLGIKPEKAENTKLTEFIKKSIIKNEAKANAFL
ncbi:MAG: hypothetical protein QXX79_02840 [Candidatus Bathyarchaeia archaeon]